MSNEMGRPPVIVHPWPQRRDAGIAALHAGQAFIAISVATPDTSIRDEARERIRAALRDLLGALANCPPQSVRLISQPGQPLRAALDLAGRAPGLSVSHEAGLSLAAIHLHGAIGIDLMRVEHRADWMPDRDTVAQDYLGAAASRRIALQPPALRPLAFAREWTRYEASLKCLGLPVAECNPILERALDNCCATDLALPEGLVGALATLY
jgi:4'-phosphopantetheinyl transferase